MTGKEALKEIRLVRVYIDEFGCAVPLKKVKEYKIIENELDELAKYKRALAIFKRLLDDDFTYGGFDDGRLLIDGAIDITDDEKKLLEELMNGE